MSIEFANRPCQRCEVSKSFAARALGISRAPLDVLMESGYLPDLDIERITNIRSARTIYSADRYPVLRSPRNDIHGLSRRDDDEQLRHWTACLTGASKEKVLRARFIPVTLSRYVISVLSITGYTSEGDGETGYRGDIAGKALTLGDPEDVAISNKLSDEEAHLVKSLLGCSVFGDSSFWYGYLPVEGP